MSKISQLALSACIIVSGSQYSLAQEPTPDQVVSAMEGNFGVNPGQRRNHIKGTCATGEFVGAPEAVALTRSPLFTGATIPVVARFSLPSGNPKLPDTSRAVRGLALQFKLPRNDVHNMAMLNTPVFGAAMPKTFHYQLIATRADPATGKPDPEKLKTFRETHPDAKALGDFLAKNAPPPSYVNSAFYGIHTFKFVDAAKRQRWFGGGLSRRRARSS